MYGKNFTQSKLTQIDTFCTLRVMVDLSLKKKLERIRKDSNINFVIIKIKAELMQGNLPLLQHLYLQNITILRAQQYRAAMIQQQQLQANLIASFAPGLMGG